MLRADVKPAKRIQLAPAQKNLRLVGSGEMLRRTLFQRPLVAGDIISTSIYQRAQQQGGGNQGNIPEDLFRMFFEQPAALLEQHPALYAELTRYYRLDPANWL